jgi:hypothetical protein
MPTKYNLNVTPHAVDRFSLRGGIQYWAKNHVSGEGIHSYLIRFSRLCVDIYCKLHHFKDDDLDSTNRITIFHDGWKLILNVHIGENDFSEWVLRTIAKIS